MIKIKKTNAVLGLSLFYTFVLCMTVFSIVTIIATIPIFQESRILQKLLKTVIKLFPKCT